MSRSLRSTNQIYRADAEIRALELEADALSRGGSRWNLLYNRIVSLRVARNALIPVNQLPAEVFIEAFSWVFASEDQAISILPITHVSHAWREVAINCNHAGFWSVIDYSNYRGGNLWLSRSRSLPVTIRLGSEPIEQFRALLKHSTRIVVLHLYPSNPTSGPSYWLSKIWEQTSFPSLRLLLLKRTDIPDGFMKSIQSSQLEALVLTKCIDISPEIISNFTNLSSLSLVWTTPRLSVVFLAEHLKAMNQLKTLVLWKVLTLPQGNVDDVPLLNLHLTKFWIRDSSWTMKWFVRQEGLIRRDTSASILFDFDASFAEEDRFGSLMDVVHSKLSGSFRQIKAVSLQSVSNRDKFVALVLMYQSTSQSTSHNTGNTNDISDVELVISCTWPIIPHILEMLPTKVDLTHTNVFRMGCLKDPYSTTPTDEVRKAAFIRSVPGVRHLHLGVGLVVRTSSLLDVLSNSTLCRRGGGGGRRLETLRIDSDSCDDLFKELPIEPDLVPRPIQTLMVHPKTKAGTKKELGRYAENVVVTRGSAFDRMDNPLFVDYHEVTLPPFEVLDRYEAEFGYGR